jgi:putative phosphoesterase
MKIAIISDSHDNVPNLMTALNYINKEKISILIHCGDLAAPSMLSEVIEPNFNPRLQTVGAREIHMVFGNVGDSDLLTEISKKYKNVTIHGERGEINIDGKHIAFCHKPEDARKLAQTGLYDIVFYGHTHKPWLDKLRVESKKAGSKEVLLVNPGTLAGLFNKATFAIYDTASGKLELKILERL